MKELIDIKFDFHSDTPQGKDPDSFSPRLRKYHQVLWSKNLPSGIKFDYLGKEIDLEFHPC